MSTKMRGYFGIGVYHPKASVNIGTLWRSAYIFGASFMFTIGKRYVKQASDTMCSYRHVPLFDYVSYDDFKENIPYNARLVCIENKGATRFLDKLEHPQQSIYLLGPEDSGLPDVILKKNIVVQIKSPKDFCLNVATAGSIVMYDRYVRGNIN